MRGPEIDVALDYDRKHGDIGAGGCGERLTTTRIRVNEPYILAVEDDNSDWKAK